MSDNQMLFYKNVAALNREKHKDLSIQRGANYKFADNVATIPLVVLEFVRASTDYPIVFIADGEGDDGEVYPAVILGSQLGENLYLDTDGKWIAEYIPAFVRRYPFIYSISEDRQQFTLCIDEDFEGCNRDGKGEALFTAETEPSEYLKEVMKFMEDYQKQYESTKAFCKILKDLDVLEPMSARFTPDSGADPHGISGFMGVNREKFKELSTENIEKLFKNDALELIYHHLHSLSNFTPLLAKANQKLSEQAEPA